MAAKKGSEKAPTPAKGGGKPEKATGGKKDAKQSAVKRPAKALRLAVGEDGDFVRGGATKMTPEDRKNAQTLDMPKNLFGDKGADAKASGPKPKKVTKKKAPSTEDKTDKEEKTKVDWLTFKRLEVGTILMGIVEAVNELDLTISLPNGLSGFVPITDVSEKMTEMLQKAAEEEESSDEEGEEEKAASKSGPGLAECYTVGDIVSCVVTKVEEGKRKRVQLSVDPALVNKRMTSEAVLPGMLLHGFVESVEDHGYIIGFGVDQLKGFLRRDAVPGGTPLFSPKPVTCVVISVNADGRTVTVSIEPKRIESAMARNAEGKGSYSYDSLCAGMLVHATVTEPKTSGLLVSFLGGFPGTIDLFHVRPGITDPDQLLTMYPPKAKVKARILYINKTTKRIALTLLPHLVERQVVSFPEVAYGTVYGNLPIIRNDSAMGLLFQLPATAGAASFGYAHISRVSDERLDKLTDKQYKPAKTHRARVVGFSLVDALVALSLQGTIASVEDYGVLVAVTDHIRGLCPATHLADIQIKNPRKKFKPGLKLTCRVMQVRADERKLLLTCKPTLVNSDLATIKAFADADMGVVAHGVVKRVGTYGAIVQFFNDVAGLLPLDEIKESGLQYEQLLWRVLKVRVAYANPTQQKIRLALQHGDGTAATENKAAAEIIPGSVCKATVERIHGDSLIVKLLPGKVAATLPSSHLTDHPNHAKPMLAFYGSKGTVLDNVVVVAKGRDRIEISAKPQLVQAVKAGHNAPMTLEEVEVGKLLWGYIRKIEAYGVFVGFVGGLSGFAALPDLADRFINNPSEAFEAGQTVCAKVVAVDTERKNIKVTLKPSVVFPDRRAEPSTGAFISSYLSEEQRFAKAAYKTLEANQQALIRLASIGTPVECTVESIQPFGAILSLDADIAAIVTNDQKDGVSIKEGDSKGLVCRALDMDLSKKVLDVSLKKDFVHAAEDAKALQKHLTHLREKQQKGERVRCIVELVKEDLLVLSLAKYGGILAVAPTRHFNDNTKPFNTFKTGQAYLADVVSVPETVRDGGPFMSRVVVDLHSAKPTHTDRQYDAAIKDVSDVRELQGRVVKGTVLKVLQYQVNVEINKTCRGRVFVTEMGDCKQGDKPLEQFNVGDEVTGRVIGLHDLKSHRHLPFSHTTTADVAAEITLRKSDVESTEEVSMEQRPTKDLLKVGDKVTAYVQKAEASRIVVFITPYLRGVVPALSVSTDTDVINNLSKHYPSGMAVTATVTALGKGDVTLSLVGPAEAIRVGSMVSARVIGKRPGAFMAVQLGGAKKRGRVQVTDMSDSYSADVMDQWAEGDYIKALVVAEDDEQVFLSLRPSRLADKAAVVKVEDKEVSSVDDIQVGDVVRGYVSNVTDSACFVVIGRNLTARIPVRELGDKQVKEPKKSFPAGAIVKGRITNIHEGKVDMSLRSKVLAKKEMKLKLKFKDLTEGMVVEGTIANIEDYGVFVAIADSSRLRGLAHKSELADEVIECITDRFAMGDLVKAKIIKLDPAKKRISLSLKPSHFADEMDEEDDEEEEEEEEEEDEEEEEEEESANEAEEEEEEEESEDEEEKASKKRKAFEALKPLNVKVGFGFGDNLSLGMSKFGESESEREDESDEEEDNEEDSKRPSKRAKKSAARAEEDSIRATEEALLDPKATPQTAADYDRLLLAKPSSSYLWIKYMSMYLGMAEIDRARAIAEQALKTISFREEKEKLNVWKALMNLEAQYGTDDTLMKTFNRALVVNEPKTMYLHLADVYAALDKPEQLNKLYEAMTKKFGQSKKVWIRYGLALLKQNKSDAARAVLKRSFKSLPRRKHVGTIVKYAQMEFKYGEVERGRTMFEEVLSNYPKRVDLWSVYLDMEIRTGDVEVIRRLFERVITLNLSSKKMKFFFKRYLEFEKTHGDSSNIDHVKQKAREYVESKMQQ